MSLPTPPHEQDVPPPRADGAVPPDDVTKVLDSVRVLFRTLRLASVDVERRLGVTLAQLFVLEQLAQHPGASINDLAVLTQTHQSSVSVVVRRLAERDLVTKRISPQDARRVELTLSDKGRDLLAQAPPTMQSQLVVGLERLGPARVHALSTTLVDWLRAAGIFDPTPPMFGDESSPRERGHT